MWIKLHFFQSGDEVVVQTQNICSIFPDQRKQYKDAMVIQFCGAEENYVTKITQHFISNPSDPQEVYPRSATLDYNAVGINDVELLTKDALGEFNGVCDLDASSKVPKSRLPSTSTPTADEVSEFDSDAHMNSTDMTTGADSELEDFIDGLNVSGGADSSGTKTYNANNGTVRLDWYKTLRVVYVVLTIRPSSAWATGSGNRITCTLDSDIPLPTNFVSGAEINGIACMILNGTSFRAQNNTGSSLAKDSNYNISLMYFT